MLMLSSREKFISFYSMFLTSHAALGVDPKELDEDGMGHVFNAVLDTVRMSVCPDLSDEEAKGIAEDYNMEMFKIRTVLDEAMRNHKLGERV
jgi:hypothetical protein